jgi:hypothetical protein
VDEQRRRVVRGLGELCCGQASVERLAEQVGRGLALLGDHAGEPGVVDDGVAHLLGGRGFIRSALGLGQQHRVDRVDHAVARDQVGADRARAADLDPAIRDPDVPGSTAQRLGLAAGQQRGRVDPALQHVGLEHAAKGVGLGEQAFEGAFWQRGECIVGRGEDRQLGRSAQRGRETSRLGGLEQGPELAGSLGELEQVGGVLLGEGRSGDEAGRKENRREAHRGAGFGLSGAADAATRPVAGPRGPRVGRESPGTPPGQGYIPASDPCRNARRSGSSSISSRCPRP